MGSAELRLQLVEICRKIAHGDYEEAKSILDLPPCDDSDDPIMILIEALSMMLVRVEAREFELSKLLTKIEKSKKELLKHKKQLTNENERLREELRKKTVHIRPIGQSMVMQELLRKVECIAEVDSTVLLTGDTGTGKGVFAKYIHDCSPRAAKPFVSINCASIPATLLESELFGIEAGVASGVERRIGRFEQASGGTILLDEIGDMPLESQAKLLHVIESGTIERVGGRKPIKVNVRIMAATLRNLENRVREKKFREDLYYRLNVIHLRIPSLRERYEDIPLLCKHIMLKYSAANPNSIKNINPKTLDLLLQYNWPGNIRELENVLERALLFSQGEELLPKDLSTEILNASNSEVLALSESKKLSLPTFVSPEKMPYINENNEQNIPRLEEVETMFIQRVLLHCNGNKSLTARKLGISREGLRIKLEKIQKNFSSLEQKA